MSNAETEAKQIAKNTAWHYRAYLIVGGACLVLGALLGHAL